MIGAPSQDDALVALKKNIRWGLAYVVVFLFMIGGWILTVEVSGAVIAAGALKVNSDVKKVQPSIGGIVKKIHVRDGQEVGLNEPLVELDDKVAQANLTLVEKSIFELHIRRDRLISERDKAEKIIFSSLKQTNLAEDIRSAVIENETRLFQLRKNSYDGRRAQLSEQMSQIDREIEGYLKQIESGAAQKVFIRQELESARSLWEKRLTTLAKLNSLEREAVRLEGETGRLQSVIAQLNGKSAELQLALLQIDKDLISEVALELRDVESKLLQLEEQKIAAKTQLDNLILKAPQSGIVNELAIKTVGGVVGVGEVLMSIVPTSDILIIEAKLNTTDIDQVKIGSETELRFSAFNQRLIPELMGRITYVSADASRDDRTGITYYVARIDVPEDQKRKLEGFPLVPGMPVEVFIKTGDRRMASILTKPMMDQLNRAFRQD